MRWFSPTIFCLASVCLPVLTATSHAQEPERLFGDSRACTAQTGRAISARLGSSRFSNVNVEAADDFVVPSGVRWDLRTIYAQGSKSMVGDDIRIQVYRDGRTLCPIGTTCPLSVPIGDPICSYIGEAAFDFPTIGFFPFEVDLPAQTCELPAGRYWISISEYRLNCGILAPCPTPWAWDESSSSNGTRPWVIRDIGNTSADITCSGFGLGSECQSQAVLPQLCFTLDGTVIDELAPRGERNLVQTIYTGEATSFDVSGAFSDGNADPLSFSSPDLPDFLTLTSEGDVSGTAAAGLALQDPVFQVTATDPAGLTGDIQVATRIVDLARVSLGEVDSRTYRRCGAPGQGLNVASTVDFSEPGNCGDADPSACRAVPSGATVVDTEVLVQVEHPSVRDLTIDVISPEGTRINLVAEPGQTEFQPVGGCDAADILAVFTDKAPRTSEQRCAAPVALGGDLDPMQPLAGFRNELVVSQQPWQLEISNSGSAQATLDQWCIQLEIEPDARPIYPQAGLPGAAELVDMGSVLERTLVSTLNSEDGVDWYFSFQPSNGVQQVFATVTPAPGQQLRIFRHVFEKFPDFDPREVAGSCEPDRIGQPVSLMPLVPGFGREFLRVQGCPGAAAGTYTIHITRIDDGLFRGFFPLPGARLSGEVLDVETSQPVSRVFVVADGSSVFSSEDGQYTSLVDNGLRTLQFFHPAYLPGELQAEAPPNVVTPVPPVFLVPVDYQASINQIVFENGFE